MLDSASIASLAQTLRGDRIVGLVAIVFALAPSLSRAQQAAPRASSEEAASAHASYVFESSTAGVRVPNGRQADVAAIAAGKFSFNPGDVKAPTLIVMGEWDQIAYFQGAQWLLHSLRQAPVRRLVVIGHGSHTIQFEIEREQLYHVMAEFLNEPDAVAADQE
jgi:alpha-beta hydrolase superfamily lysophospholipase